MTIKEFAHICGCNPQTLRYYDQIDLLKPVKVDRWSGYRFYDEEQAYVFVKIKNLQKAGFTIDEIRGLLDKDNLAICRAFDEKIAKEEKRLQEIKDIRQSYQTEMNSIKDKIDAVRKKITEEMQAYNQTSEFGLLVVHNIKLGRRCIVNNKVIKKECEELWAKNKYFVLSKSHKTYLEIREYLKEKEVDILYLQDKIQKVRDMAESKKDFSNAILHIWGYFKKDASENEKQGLFDILEEYMDGKNNQESVIEYINALLKKYPNKYLQESTLLTGENI